MLFKDFKRNLKEFKDLKKDVDEGMKDDEQWFESMKNRKPEVKLPVRKFDKRNEVDDFLNSDEASQAKRDVEQGKVTKIGNLEDSKD